MQWVTRRLCATRVGPIEILLIAFVLLGTIYNVVTPLFEGPDEPGHYQYVTYLADGHGLPIQSFKRSELIVDEGHQPPLYYALGALLTFWIDRSNGPDIYRANPAFSAGTEPNILFHTAAELFPFRGMSLVVRIARLLSTLLGAVTVWCTYRLGQIVARNKWVALGAAAVVAFNPQFVFISSMMNNDNGVTAFSALACVVMATMLIEGHSRRRAIWLGVWIGLAVLCKVNALALLLAAVFVVTVITARRRSGRTFVDLAFWIGLPVLVISGWWFARNQLLYSDPLGYQMFISTHGSDNAPKDFSQITTWAKFIGAVHQSFWGKFGWLKIPLRDPLYDLLAWPYSLALLGALVGAVWRRETDPQQPSGKLGWLFLSVVFLSVAASAIAFGRGQGRYLFPAIPAIALLIVGGISAIVPDRLRYVPIGLVVGSLFVLAVSVPSAYIAPTYRFFTLPESALADVPHRLGGTFSPEIALPGYSLRSESASFLLTLYWQAQGTPQQDYKVFIHVINSHDQLCGQQDSLPLDGAFPMLYWRANDVIEDAHTVPFEPTCCVNGACHLRVGLYDADTGQRLLYSINGQPISDHIEINP